MRPRAHTPCDCHVYCTLPRSLAEYVDDLERGPDTRVAPSHMRQLARRHVRFSPERAWAELERGDIGKLERGFEQAARFGARIVRGVSFSDFTPDTDARVVILIAHTSNGEAEFRDGFHSGREVAERFCPDYDGVIDLSLCSSFPLHDELRIRCGSAPRIVTSNASTTVGTRIAVCVLAMELLRRTSATYDEAVAQVLALRCALETTRKGPHS